VDGAHPGVEFLLPGAGEVAELLAAHGHHRSVDGQPLVDPLRRVVPHLLQAGGDGQQRLARARRAVEGHHGDLRVEEEVEGEALFDVAGLEVEGLQVRA
jgi:hypothetical protein